MQARKLSGQLQPQLQSVRESQHPQIRPNQLFHARQPARCKCLGLLRAAASGRDSRPIPGPEPVRRRGGDGQSADQRPGPRSLEIGQGKGLYVWDNKEQGAPGLEFIFTAVFGARSGFLAGSTLQYRGFDYLPLPVREISIVGGTGQFRLARGWAEFQVHSVNNFAAVLNFTSYVYYGGT